MIGHGLVDLAVANALVATVLAAGVGLACRWVENPAFRRALWLIVLLRLVTPPVFEIDLPGDGGLFLPGMESANQPGAPSPDARSAEPLSASAVSSTSLALTLWLFGSIGIASVGIVRTWRCRRLLAGAAEAPEELRTRVAELATTMGVRRPPRVLLAEVRLIPFLDAGFRHARLVVPRRLVGRLSSAQLDTLICHELAHLLRRDSWVRILEQITVTLYWWHPVAWWARRAGRAAEEACCDAQVTMTLPEHRRAYASCLLSTTRFLQRQQPVLASGLGGSHDLERRLTMILTRDTRPTLPSSGRWLLALGALCLLAVSPNLSGPSWASDEATEADLLDLHADDATLAAVLAPIARVGGINLMVRRDVDPSLTVSARYDGVPWDLALDQLLERYGLATSTVGNLVWVVPDGARPTPGYDFVGGPITLQLRDADLRRTLESFGGPNRIRRLHLEPGVEGRVTIDVRNVPWDQVFDAILRSTREYGYYVRGTSVDVVVLDPAESTND